MLNERSNSDLIEVAKSLITPVTLNISPYYGESKFPFSIRALESSMSTSFFSTYGMLLAAAFSDDSAHPVTTSGWRNPWHLAIDWVLRGSNSIVSPFNGVLVASGSIPGYGNTVAITHSTPFVDDLYLVCFFAHLSAPSSFTAGDEIQSGDVIGYQGNTGIGTGTHVHAEFFVLREREVQALIDSKSSVVKGYASRQAIRRIDPILACGVLFELPIKLVLPTAITDDGVFLSLSKYISHGVVSR